MRFRRLVAGIGAAVLVLGTTATMTAPAAQAFGPTFVALPTSVFIGHTPGATIASFNNTYTDTFTLTTAPAGAVNAGTAVAVSLSASLGPFIGPVGIPAATQVIRATMQLSGAQTGLFQLLDPNSLGGSTCAYPLAPTPPNTRQGGWSVVGNYTATGSGPVNVALFQIFFDDQGNLDGSVPNLCPGSGSNVDQYNSSVTQVSGSNVFSVAKTAPQASTVIVEPITHVGPNATAGIASFQSIPGFVRPGVGPPPASNPVTVPLTGTVWDANVAVGGFTAEFCNTSGSSCDAASTNTLGTDGSGNLTGNVTAQAGLTTGSRAIKLTQAANTSLTPIVVLAAASITGTPASGGPGTPVAITGSNFNPTQNVTVGGFVTFFPTFTPTADPPVVSPASGTGTLSTSFTVNDSSGVGIYAFQGVPGPPNVSNPSAFFSPTPNADRCVAYVRNLTGGPGCTTRQNINLSVLQGRLVQRAYVNSTPTVGSIDGSGISSPIQGTANANPDATTVNLGSITTPLAPSAIVGSLNDITVSDNRGGSFGWTLSATMPAFTGSPNSNTIAASRLAATPACAPATNATAWDYEASGKTAIVGFDATLNAPGVSAGSAGQNFGSAVNLCTKDGQENPTTQSSGGVYNVTSTLTLTVPAFQAADRYTSTITVLLA